MFTPYAKDRSFALVINLFIELVNKIKRRELKWLPWGTPDETSTKVELELSILTNCMILKTYDLIQGSNSKTSNT